MSRDTQFQGFAKALWEEISTTYIDDMQVGMHDVSGVTREIEQVIARRAYDLACHVVTHCDEDIAWRKGKGYSVEQIVENDVPDLLELPKEQE